MLVGLEERIVQPVPWPQTNSSASIIPIVDFHGIVCRYARRSIAPSSHPHRNRLLPALFSPSTMSSPNLKSIRDALDTYAEQMKIDLKDNPFAEEIKGCNSPEAILQLLEKNRDKFKEYREKNRKFIDCLNPVVKFVHAFSNVLGEATSLVSAQRRTIMTVSFF